MSERTLEDCKAKFHDPSSLKIELLHLDVVKQLLVQSALMAEALDRLCAEAPKSVEYSDWPELQAAVHLGQVSLSAFREIGEPKVPATH